MDMDMDMDIYGIRRMGQRDERLPETTAKEEQQQQHHHRHSFDLFPCLHGTIHDNSTRRRNADGYLYFQLLLCFPFLLWGKESPGFWWARTPPLLLRLSFLNSIPLKDLFLSQVTSKISCYTASAELSGTVPRGKKAKSLDRFLVCWSRRRAGKKWGAAGAPMEFTLDVYQGLVCDSGAAARLKQPLFLLLGWVTRQGIVWGITEPMRHTRRAWIIKPNGR
ncbi:uncharacterized protein B0H64DRAFT_404395, partial [Chaetomium fimeti]